MIKKKKKKSCMKIKNKMVRLNKTSKIFKKKMNKNQIIRRLKMKFNKMDMSFSIKSKNYTKNNK
jgi:hypothetical protein